MLEKIGLPAKPSMRGGNWVVDASHCQGCSSQFTFINRKHHCRRCGGLFCNSCTQQRLALRGQGDSPVRICDPCKKLEEAARFELRHGNRKRAAKGTSKQVPNPEEEILSQILGIDGKQESHDDMISGLLRATSTASSSSLKEVSAGVGDAFTDAGSCTPEELRQQAVEEKKRYRILKGEGKDEEALQTFKRAKELERQAGALDIALRKSRRMTSMAKNLTGAGSTEKIDDSQESSKKKFPLRNGKEEKDDLAGELRELGWCDADLHDADNKPVKQSLEGELSNLLREVPQNSSTRKTGGIDKSRVVALKRNALQLKRAGKLAEAKEELKRAKILEKQLEEQELLGESEESDDELSALIRNMDDDKQDDFLLNNTAIPSINFDDFGGLGDDLVTHSNLEVTDDDMNNPDLANALRSFGWTEEDDNQAIDEVLKPNPSDQEALRGKVLTLKKDALSQKRAGNVAEAMSLLKKAKLLEKDLEIVQSDDQTFAQEHMPKSFVSHVPGKTSLAGIDAENIVKLPPKSRIAIQRELLALKKKALALRREGRTEEADEELKKGKLLEQQLEEMENAPKRPVPKVEQKNLKSGNIRISDPGTFDLGDGEETEVTEEDIHDPSLMSVLKNLGWNEDDAETENVSMTNRTVHDSTPSVIPRKSRSKAEIQRELLGLKRKALGLRRQGKIDEAEQELEMAKDLEAQLAEMEASSIAKFAEVESEDSRPFIAQVKPDMEASSIAKSKEVESHNLRPAAAQVKPHFIVKADGDLSSLSSTVAKDEENYSREADTETNPSQAGPISAQSFRKVGTQPEGPPNESFSTFQSDVTNSFSHSGSKVLLATVGAQGDHLHDKNVSLPTASFQTRIQFSAKENTVNENDHKLMTPEPNLAHGIDAQRTEILARKRWAVALKREGKLAEAREELRQAKLLEKSLEETNQQANIVTKVEVATTSFANPVVVQETRTNPVVQETRTNQQAQKPLSGRDRFKVQQESLAHKRKALKLRREGKIEESDAELELAKELEARLEEFDTEGSSTSKTEGKDDVGIDDLLDPQLRSALKSLGWGDSDMGAQQPIVSQDISKKLESVSNMRMGMNPQGERARLEDMIKAEKVRALGLKREGKQAEAMEALRSAKLLEKKLDSLA